ADLVVHGHEQWGLQGLLQRLDGHFGFCLWDGRSRNLYLARDPLGIQTVFYSDRNRRFACGSELRHLFCTGLLNGQLDELPLWRLWRVNSVRSIAPCGSRRRKSCGGSKPAVPGKATSHSRTCRPLHVPFSASSLARESLNCSPRSELKNCSLRCHVIRPETH